MTHPCCQRRLVPWCLSHGSPARGRRSHLGTPNQNFYGVAECMHTSHACTHMYIHVHTNICTRRCVYVNAHRCTYMCGCARVHCTQVCGSHTRVHAQTCVICTEIRARTHPHCTCVHTHVQTRAHLREPALTLAGPRFSLLWAPDLFQGRSGVGQARGRPE